VDDALRLRLDKVYRAVGATIEDDLSTFQPSVSETAIPGGGKVVAVFQDFRAGRTDDDLQKDIEYAVDKVAHVKDPLARWAKTNGKDASKVEEAVRRSVHLQVVIDLANAEKHGAHDRKGGHSGRLPRLTELCRVMRLSTGATPNSSAAVEITPRGLVPQLMGSGSASVVTTAKIVDNAGAEIGDLADYLEQAVAVWERLLTEYGALSATTT
jgi:hypothetical protein